jgi:hypothetical protein
VRAVQRPGVNLPPRAVSVSDGRSMASNIPGRAPAHTPAEPIFGPIPSTCRCSWAWTGGTFMRLKVLSGGCPDHQETPRIHWDDQPQLWGQWRGDGDRELIGGLFRRLAVADQ